MDQFEGINQSACSAIAMGAGAVLLVVARLARDPGL
jgi:hypothetical protein